jgi:hypothetical protein
MEEEVESDQFAVIREDSSTGKGQGYPSHFI